MPRPTKTPIATPAQSAPPSFELGGVRYPIKFEGFDSQAALMKIFAPWVERFIGKLSNSNLGSLTTCHCIFDFQEVLFASTYTAIDIVTLAAQQTDPSITLEHVKKVVGGPIQAITFAIDIVTNSGILNGFVELVSLVGEVQKSQVKR